MSEGKDEVRNFIVLSSAYHYIPLSGYLYSRTPRPYTRLQVEPTHTYTWPCQLAVTRWCVPPL